MDNTVTIGLDVVERTKDQPQLWNDLWRIGWLNGCRYEADASAFDALCKAHFSPFAPGEVVHAVAEPVAKTARIIVRKAFTNCKCAERRLAMNLA